MGVIDSRHIKYNMDGDPFKPFSKYGSDFKVRSRNPEDYEGLDASFNVKKCPICKKAFEQYVSCGGNRKGGTIRTLQTIYYGKDFPTISCREEICPQCKNENQVKQ